MDDKSFGDTKNWRSLGEVGEHLREINPGFFGFIVQMPPSLAARHGFLEQCRDLGVRYVEFGVETADNALLRYLRKPFRVRHLDRACEIVRDLGMYAGLRLVTSPAGLCPIPASRRMMWESKIDGPQYTVEGVAGRDGHDARISTAGLRATRHPIVGAHARTIHLTPFDSTRDRLATDDWLQDYPEVVSFDFSRICSNRASAHDSRWGHDPRWGNIVIAGEDRDRLLAVSEEIRARVRHP